MPKHSSYLPSRKAYDRTAFAFTEPTSKYCLIVLLTHLAKVQVFSRKNGVRSGCCTEYHYSVTLTECLLVLPATINGKKCTELITNIVIYTTNRIKNPVSVVLILLAQRTRYFLRI